MAEKPQSPYGVRLRNALGQELTQWYGSCGECCRANVPIAMSAAGEWLCEECAQAREQAECSRLVWGGG